MRRSDITDEQVVQACIDFHDSHGPISGFVLSEVTGAPRNVVTAAMERAVKRGLIEYGVSLWTAWPTDKGRALVGGEDPKTEFRRKLYRIYFDTPPEVRFTGAEWVMTPGDLEHTAWASAPEDRYERPDPRREGHEFMGLPIRVDDDAEEISIQRRGRRR